MPGTLYVNACRCASAYAGAFGHDLVRDSQSAGARLLATYVLRVPKTVIAVSTSMPSAMDAQLSPWLPRLLLSKLQGVRPTGGRVRDAGHARPRRRQEPVLRTVAAPAEEVRQPLQQHGPNAPVTYRCRGSHWGQNRAAR